MGIECYLSAIHETTLDWLFENPERMDSYIQALDTHPHLEEQLHAMEEVPKSLLESIDFQRQERIAARSELVKACPHQELSKDLDRGCFSLDKAWALVDSVLRTLASSEDPVLALAIRGGQDLGPSIGYDHPQVVLPPRVKAVSGALSGTTDSRFSDAARAVHRHRGGQQEELLDDQLGALLPFFANLRSFYAQASRDGLAVVSFLT